MILMNEETTESHGKFCKDTDSLSDQQMFRQIYSRDFRKRIIKAAFQEIHRPIAVCAKYYREPWKRRSSDDQRSITDQSSWSINQSIIFIYTPSISI